nr:hypothetical protein EAVNVH72_03817 [Elizabethkingia anophelis]
MSSLCLSDIKLKMNSILVAKLFSALLIKSQKASFCNAYSILSHSDAISNCFKRNFSASAFAKLELFRNNALINSAFVRGIFPLLILVKISIESSFIDVSYQITFVEKLNLDSNVFISNSCPLPANQSHIVLYAEEMK